MSITSMNGPCDGHLVLLQSAHYADCCLQHTITLIRKSRTQRTKCEDMVNDSQLSATSQS